MKYVRKIGILGGMGPLATAELFKMIVLNTDSADDQGHIRIFIDNNPQIPDRTKAILGEGASPLPELVSSAVSLKTAGADFIIIPCNTSHFFLDDIQQKAGIEALNMLELTARLVKKSGAKKVGLLATTGSVKTGLYEKAFSRYGIETVYPSEHEQEKVMRFIYEDVKGGHSPMDMQSVIDVGNSMTDKGAELIVLGCTEFSVVSGKIAEHLKCIDPMLVLAKAAIVKAGYSLKDKNEQDEYIDLLEPFRIERLSTAQTKEALPFICEVFAKYEAPNYPEDGREAFYRAINSEDYLNMLTSYGAFDGDRLVGIIALRNEGSHIALFFVDGEYHRKGIGRALINECLKDNKNTRITVNSSSFAAEIYEKLGFIKEDEMKEDDGIRYIPMALYRKT